jgi:hypothetical protein
MEITYISTGMDMGSFDEAFKGMTVDDFKVHKNGYLIITKK